MSLLIRSAYGFGSDGAAVMVGKQSCVATQLKEHNPEMVSLHCGAHRLALASSQAVGYISYLKNLMHTSLHFISIEELGRHRGREGRREWLLCDDECESVRHVLWDCPVYSTVQYPKSKSNPASKAHVHEHALYQ